jgi:hypothetical protein
LVDPERAELDRRRRRWPYRKQVNCALREGLWRVMQFDLNHEYRIEEIAGAMADLLAELIHECAPQMTNTEIESAVSRMAASIALQVAQMRREHRDG